MIKIPSKLQLNLYTTITIAWIRTSSNLLKIFTGNRVYEIQTLVGARNWQHVPSSYNPVDYASREMLGI